MLLSGAHIPCERPRCSKRTTQTLSPYPSSATSTGILPGTCWALTTPEGSQKPSSVQRTWLPADLTEVASATEPDHGSSLALQKHTVLRMLLIHSFPLSGQHSINCNPKLRCIFYWISHSLKRILLWIISYISVGMKAWSKSPFMLTLAAKAHSPASKPKGQFLCLAWIWQDFIWECWIF